MLELSFTGLSSWLEWTHHNLFCGVKCIAKKKGNDNERNMFGYRSVSYKLEAIKSVTRGLIPGSIICEPYYMVFICWLRIVKGSDPSKKAIKAIH